MSASIPSQVHNPREPAPAPAAGPRIIAFMNQKGGVGKTTAAVNLGAALALRGRRVLLIDMDPQAHLSLHVGVVPEDPQRSMYDLLLDPSVGVPDILVEATDNLFILPSEVNLAGAETELAPLAAQGRAQRVLRDKVLAAIATPAQPSQSTASVVDPQVPNLKSQASAYDFILIDCPPSLGLLTLNALSLAREVFVPMQAHFLALQGLSKLLATVNMVRQSVNRELLVSGIILCIYDGQTVLANEVMQDLESFLAAARSLDVPWRDARLLQPSVRRNIKLAECPSFGQTIFDYAPLCPGAQDYRQLADAVLAMRS